MSIIYTASIEKAACYKNLSPLRITTHAHDGQNGVPSVTLTIQFGNGQISVHLSPKDAERCSRQLKDAAEIADACEVKS